MECSCKECQSYCQRRVGWFHPDEIEPLAKQMKLTVKELFDEHLTVDFWCGSESTNWEDVFVLAPRTHNQNGGEIMPFNPLGVCHWFKDGKCEVHKKGKPAECAFADHTRSNEATKEHRHKIVQAWQSHQKLIHDLLGYAPEKSEPESFMEAFGLF